MSAPVDYRATSAVMVAGVPVAYPVALSSATCLTCKWARRARSCATTDTRTWGAP